MTNVHSLMSIPHLLETLNVSGRLPSPQGVALEVLRLCQLDDLDIAQIARIIQADPVLTGKILKASNSSLLATSRSITTINDAIMMLGLIPVRNLVLGFSLIGDYQSGVCHAFDYQMFWRKSLLMAVSPQTLAAKIQFPSQETLFISGLLVDIGHLSLASLFPEKYDALIPELLQTSDRLMWRAYEQRCFATDHVTLTLALLNDWGLSSETLQVLQRFLDEEDITTVSEQTFGIAAQQQQLVLLLKLAEQIVNFVFSSTSHRQEKMSDLMFFAARIGIDADDLSLLTEQIELIWHEWLDLVGLPLPFSSHSSVRQLNTDHSSAAHAIFRAASATDVVAVNQANSQSATSSKLRCLVVDDDSTMLLVLKKTLQQAGHQVITAQDGQIALEYMLTERPEVVITDWVMPMMDGLQLVQALRETEIGKHAYILLLTSFEQDERLIEAFDAGVDDYLQKPFIPRVLLARLRAAERFIQLQRAFAKELTEIRRFASELAINNRKLQQTLLTDVLTGLPNRRFGLDRLEQELALAKRRGSVFSIIVAEIDHFKLINDMHGHDIADLVLCFIADLLHTKSRLQDLICRMSGEAFLIICPDTGSEEITSIVGRLRAAVATTPFTHNICKIQLSLSFGAATLQSYEQTASGLLKLVDSSLHQAKPLGHYPN